MVRVVPPSGKNNTLIAETLSDEHVYIFEGGYEDRTGRQIRFPGDYILNPKGIRHDFITSEETVTLVICNGEPDRVIEIRALD